MLSLVIRYKLKEQQSSYRQLALKSQLGYNTVLNVANGLNRPRFDVFQELVFQLELTPDEVMLCTDKRYEDLDDASLIAILKDFYANERPA